MPRTETAQAKTAAFTAFNFIVTFFLRRAVWGILKRIAIFRGDANHQSRSTVELPTGTQGVKERQLDFRRRNQTYCLCSEKVSPSQISQNTSIDPYVDQSAWLDAGVTGRGIRAFFRAKVWRTRSM